MPVAAALAAAGIGSALIGANAASNAADAQANAALQSGQMQLQAAQTAAQLQLGMFNTIRGDLSGYRGVGQAAIPGYMALLGLSPPSSGAASPASDPNSFYYTPSQQGSGGQLIIPGLSGSGSGVTPMSAATGSGLVIPGVNDAPTLGSGASFMPSTAGVAGGGTQTGGTPAVGGWYGTPQNADWTSFLKDPANADVLAWAQSGHGDPNTPIDQQSLAQRAAYWYWHAGQMGDPRAKSPLPTIAAPTSSPGAGTGAPGAGAGTPNPSLTGQPGTGTGNIEAYLSSLPGYQFTLDQGIKGVTNAMSARGLSGVSGPLAKGIARFVTGLADQTYQQQLDNMAGAVGVGQSAANQTGAFGNSAAGNAGSSMVGGAGAYGSGIVGAANAAAGGNIGVANAVGSGLGSLGNAFLTSRILGMYGGGGGAAAAAAAPSDMVGLY